MDAALHAVAKLGVALAIPPLIEAGAAVDAPDQDGWTPLMHASAGSHTAAMRELITAGANVEMGVNGVPLLHMAIQATNILVMRTLLQAGASPDSRNHNTSTALMAAVAKRVDCVKLLLDYGANVNAHADLEGESPLAQAAYGDSPATLQLLLNAGADTEYLSGDQRTPLMKAAMVGSVINIRILLNGGALLNAEGADAATAFTCACSSGALYAANELYNAGAPVNYIEDDRQSPLHRAVLGGEDMVYYLLELEADVNKTYKFDNSTPLIVAVRHGFRNIAHMLLRAGADIKAAKRGEEPIEKSPIVQEFLLRYTGRKSMNVDVRWVRRRPAIQLWENIWQSGKPLLKELL